MSLSLEDAENIFIKKNLLLLSQRYQVSAARAGEIQAKLYPNPAFSTELQVKAQGRPWFDWGSNGQKTFGVDQLILLAGKRNKRIQLATEDTRQAEFALYDLMRTLKYQLRQSFITLAYANILSEQLSRQIQLLQHIVTAYEEQSAKRNVSMKDVVRLKTELIQLSSQQNDILNSTIDARQTMQLLLDTSAYIKPVYDTAALKANQLAFNNLVEKAFNSRSDLQLVQSQVKQAGINEQYQREMARPDLTLGSSYDQNGSYAPKFFSLNAAIDLPFFNRNQGNIKMAQEQRKVVETGLAYKQSSIQSELAAALDHIRQSENTYQVIQGNFNKDYPAINEGIIENFNRGNISILDFLDFFESYNSAIEAINELKKERALAYEELEYVVGASL